MQRYTFDVILVGRLVGKRVTELYSKGVDVLTDDFAPADLSGDPHQSARASIARLGATSNA